MAKSKNQKTKSKTEHVDDDEQLLKSRQEQADEEAGDVDAEDADEEATELDADEEAAESDVEEADQEATEADTDDAEADGDAEAEADAETADAEKPDADGDEDEESVDKGPIAPPAKITKTALVLILLNWIAAPMFGYVAYLDDMVRVQYSYRTMLNYVQVWGLPLKSEDDAASLSNETRPLIVLTPEQLKTAFKSRPGVVKTLKEEFAPFEESIEKRVPFRLRPKDMTPDLLRDVFQGHSDAVATLDEEIVRLEKTLPGDIQQAAVEVKEALAKNTDDEKRAIVKKALLPFTWDSLQAKKLEAQLDEAKGADLDALVKRTVIRNVLFTIAWDVWQVKKLEDQLEKAKGAELDNLLEDAVQRRIYYDILAPINVFRPGDIKDFKNYKIERITEKTLDQVKEFMQQRLKAAVAKEHDLDVHIGPEVWNKAQETPNPEALKRDSVERRQKIAFILFALSQVSVPALDKKPLYPKGVERAQIVCGLHEFTNASIRYVVALRILEERIVNSVIADRQGYVTALKEKQGQWTSTNGFTAEYDAEIDRLVKIVDHIGGLEKRLADLRSQKDHFQKIHGQRAEQHKKTLEKLIDARKRTEEYVKELRLRQDQLHAALVDLSEAGDRNFQLYLQIRDIELSLNQQTKKGGKKQP